MKKICLITVLAWFVCFVYKSATKVREMLRGHRSRTFVSTEWVWRDSPIIFNLQLEDQNHVMKEE